MYYHNNELPPQQGWVCPKCGRVNAPWKSSCDCVSTQTTGTGTAYFVKTSSVSQNSHEIEQTEPKYDALEVAKDINRRIDIGQRLETMSCQECKYWKYIAKEWQCSVVKCQYEQEGED